MILFARFMNTFAILDELKTIKASIKNDATSYLRTIKLLEGANVEIPSLAITSKPCDGYTHTSVLSTPKCNQCSMCLQFFLAEPDVVSKRLVETLQDLDVEDFIIDMINTCIRYYENQYYITTDEKHMYVNAIGFSLNLLEGSLFEKSKKAKKNSMDIYKLEKRKKMNFIRKIDEIFKRLPVVKLFGDTHIKLSKYIVKMQSYPDNARRWTCHTDQPIRSTPPEARQQLDLLYQLPVIKDQHIEFVTELALFSNTYSNLSSTKQGAIQDGFHDSQLYNLALRGIKLLGNWTALVTEIFSWKLANPNTEIESTKERTIEDYERATGLNYESAEKNALIEIIGMIKGVQSLMHNMEHLFSSAICSFIYRKIQYFVQIELREPIRKCIKKKKTKIVSILNDMRTSCALWDKVR